MVPELLITFPNLLNFEFCVCNFKVEIMTINSLLQLGEQIRRQCVEMVDRINPFRHL